MRQAIETFCNRLRILARNARTLVLYRRYLLAHADWLQQRKVFQPEQVRLSHLESYTRYLLRRYATRSVRARVALFARFYHYLAQQGLITENPARGLSLPKCDDPLPPSPPDVEAVQKFISRVSTSSPVGQRNRAMMEVLFSTGLRASELISLELGDVRLRDRTIMVRSGKGNKDRVVLLSKRAQDALSVYIERTRPLLLEGLPGHEGWAEHSRRNGRSPDRALWLCAHGGVFADYNLRLFFRYYSKATGQHLHAHLIRHAFAVHLLRRGADIRHVQVLLGHGDIDTTKIYLRLVKDDYKRAYDRAFPHITLRLPEW